MAHFRDGRVEGGLLAEGSIAFPHQRGRIRHDAQQLRPAIMYQQTIPQHFHRPSGGNGDQPLVAHVPLNFLKQALHVLGLDRQQDEVAFLNQLQVALHDGSQDTHR